MIRRFELADIEEILQIEARAFPKSSYTADMFLDFYSRYSDTFLILEEEKVHGYIIFKLDGHVISLAVDPRYRRRGIGTRLMTACESCCKGERLFVEVREGNIVAQRFYEKLGFALKARISRYYGTEDALVMGKNWPPAKD
jgi:ribosomal-protein-alanine N-acetyltransferase